MKSYTDLEQSKKLAEFLPLESADMYWWSTSLRYYIEAMDDGDFVENRDIRAWSLAALLDILPRVDIEKELWSSDKYDFRVKAYIDDGYVGDWFDNPIDACVEMILKLHEQNLL